MIEHALYYTTVNDATVTGIVGSGVYPAGDVPQGPTYPMVTYQRIGTEPTYEQITDADIDHVSAQFVAYAVTRLAALALADAVRDVWTTPRGFLGPSNTEWVERATVESVIDRGQEFYEEGSQVRLHSVAVIVSIWHRRA